MGFWLAGAKEVIIAASIFANYCYQGLLGAGFISRHGRRIVLDQAFVFPTLGRVQMCCSSASGRNRNDNEIGGKLRGIRLR